MLWILSINKILVLHWKYCQLNDYIFLAISKNLIIEKAFKAKI